jgi:flagellar export protein FliJ
LQAYDILLQKSDAAIVEIDKEIERRKRVMDKEMELYVKMTQDRRAVELLKEKAYKQYQVDANREETAVLDEIGRNSFLNNKADKENSDN